MDEFVYEFTVWDAKAKNKRTVTGLSYAGVKQIAHRLGHIRVLDLTVEELRDNKDGPVVSYRVKARARNDATEQEMFGVVQEDVNKPWGRDAFALSKAVSKAQRNAIRVLIPETVAIQMLKMYRKQAKAKIQAQTTKAAQERTQASRTLTGLRSP